MGRGGNISPYVGDGAAIIAKHLTVPNDSKLSFDNCFVSDVSWKDIDNKVKDSGEIHVHDYGFGHIGSVLAVVSAGTLLLQAIIFRNVSGGNAIGAFGAEFLYLKEAVFDGIAHGAALQLWRTLLRKSRFLMLPHRMWRELLRPKVLSI